VGCRGLVAEYSASDRRAVAELSLMLRCSVAVISLLSPLFSLFRRCYCCCGQTEAISMSPGTVFAAKTGNRIEAITHAARGR
jgi:hypothetical protein